MGCHTYLGGNPVLFSEWAKAQIGHARIEMLAERHRTVLKNPKQYEKDIAAHYKAEWETLCKKRFQGQTGRIEFLSYW